MYTPPTHITRAWTPIPAPRPHHHYLRWLAAMLMLAALTAALIADARARYEQVPPPALPPCVVSATRECTLLTDGGASVQVSVGYLNRVYAATATPKP